MGILGSNLILIKFIIGVYMTKLAFIRQNCHIQDNIGPFRPYLYYIGPIQESPIESGNYQGQPWVQPDTYKVHYRDHMTNLGDLSQKLPIQGKIGPFRPYLHYIGPIQVSPTVPVNHQGHLWVQPDTYKFHYRGLYGQPRLYHYIYKLYFCSKIHKIYDKTWVH